MKKQQVSKIIIRVVIGLVAISLTSPALAFPGIARGAHHVARASHVRHATRTHQRTLQSSRPHYQYATKTSYQHVSTAPKITKNNTNNIVVSKPVTNHVNTDVTPKFTYHSVGDHIQDSWNDTKNQIHDNWDNTKNNIHNSWDNTKDNIHDDYDDNHDDDWDWNDADTWMLVGATALVGTSFLMANNHDDTQTTTYVPYNTAPTYYYTTPSATGNTSSNSSGSTSSTEKVSTTTNNYYYDNSNNTTFSGVKTSDDNTTTPTTTDTDTLAQYSFDSEDMLVSLGDLTLDTDDTATDSASAPQDQTVNLTFDQQPVVVVMS